MIRKELQLNKSQKTNIAKKKQPREIEAPVGENDGEFIEYKVKKGDTIDKIATFFNVDREELIESNNLQGLKNKKLSPGRTVLVPKIIDEGEEEIVNLTNKPIKPWKDSDEKYMLVKVAKSFMGAPYKYGGNTVKGLDCSAYVKKIYEIFDVQLPRSAREQFRVGSQIRKEELAVGDLVFFKTKRYVKYPTHVGIYIGDGNFIHSSSGHGRIGVKIDALSSDYYTKAFTGATRIKDGLFEERSDATSIQKPLIICEKAVTPICFRRHSLFLRFIHAYSKDRTFLLLFLHYILVVLYHLSRRSSFLKKRFFVLNKYLPHYYSSDTGVF